MHRLNVIFACDTKREVDLLVRKSKCHFSPKLDYKLVSIVLPSAQTLPRVARSVLMCYLTLSRSSIEVQCSDWLDWRVDMGSYFQWSYRSINDSGGTWCKDTARYCCLIRKFGVYMIIWLNPCTYTISCKDARNAVEWLSAWLKKEHSSHQPLAIYGHVSRKIGVKRLVCYLLASCRWQMSCR